MRHDSGFFRDKEDELELQPRNSSISLLPCGLLGMRGSEASPWLKQQI